MNPTEFMNARLDSMRAIVSGLPPAFDSHQFITCFVQLFQADYERLLSRFATAPHRKVNAQIALWLSKNVFMLKIEKNGKVQSENILGNITGNEQWLKAN